jgi:cell division protein ZapA
LGQVTVKIRDRAYRFSCADGEEARLEALGAYVDGKIGELVAQFGRIGDERLMVMAALMLADELFDARGKTPSGAAEGETEAA